MNADTALITLRHFRRVVLESLQGRDLSFVDYDVVANQPDCGAPCNLAFRDVTAGNSADLGNFEDVAHFGGTQPGFLDRRFEHTDHGALNFIDDVIDDRVEPNVD